MDKKVHLGEKDFFVHLENVSMIYRFLSRGGPTWQDGLFVHLGEMDLAVKMDLIFAM